MSVTVGRFPHSLQGTPSSPYSLAANASVDSILNLTSDTNTVDAVVGVVLEPGGSAPTTPTVFQNWFSLDGLNYIADGPPGSITLVASTQVALRYDPPKPAQLAKVTITCGSTNGISLWSQGANLTFT
jgi:hypothetical protein